MRDAVPDDLDALRILFQASVREVCRADYVPAQVALWASFGADPERWRQRLSGLTIVVAERAGETAGFGAGTTAGYIDLLYVHPHHLRRGVATCLMDRLERHAEACGHTAVTSDVSITARPFFERRGYRVLRTNRVRRGGEVFINYAMWKPLPLAASPNPYLAT